MIDKLLTEHHFEFLSLKGGCRGSSESTLVKMSNCWKSQAAAQFIMCYIYVCKLFTNMSNLYSLLAINLHSISTNASFSVKMNVSLCLVWTTYQSLEIISGYLLIEISII